MKFLKSKMALVVAGVSLCAAQGVMAAPPSTGDTIQVLDTAGRLGVGGPFLVMGGTYAGPAFETFCLETNEFLSLGNTYTVTVNTGAVNGGVGSAATYAGDVAGTSTFDPISKATGWIYNAYFNGGVGLTGWTGSASDKAEVQKAIWFLENETASATGTALAWANIAIANAPSYSFNVGVMNLTDAGGRHQDLLYVSAVPEPETYAMMLAGLGLMGFVARRRKQSVATA